MKCLNNSVVSLQGNGNEMYIWKSTDNSWCIINEWCLFQCSKLTSSITLSFLFFLAYFFPRATQLWCQLFKCRGFVLLTNIPMIEEAKVRLNPKPNQNSYHPGFAAEYSVLTNVYLSPFTTTSLDVNFFFNYTNTIFVLYFEFVWWGGLTLPANLLKGPAFHFSDHYMEKLLLIRLESLSDLEYASLWEFKQMKTIYFTSEFSAEVFFSSYYTKFFQNAYVSEMFV